MSGFFTSNQTDSDSISVTTAFNLVDTFCNKRRLTFTEFEAISELTNLSNQEEVGILYQLLTEGYLLDPSLLTRLISIATPETWVASPNHQLLSDIEEFELASSIQHAIALGHSFTGSENIAEDALSTPEYRMGLFAIQTLMERNQKIVMMYARKYARRGKPSLTVDDLFQEGMLGLRHATLKFDPERGFRFTTYASWWIRQAIARAIANQKFLIRLPVYAQSNLDDMQGFINAKLADVGIAPTIYELRKQFSVDEETFKTLRPYLIFDLDFSDEFGLVKAIEQTSFNSELEKQIDSQELSLVLQSQLHEILDDREYSVIIKRFDFYDFGEAPTLEKVGLDLNLTRERIRQIEKTARSKLLNSPLFREIYDAYLGAGLDEPALNPNLRVS